MAKIPVGIRASVRPRGDDEAPLEMALITCEGGCGAWTPHARDISPLCSVTPIGSCGCAPGANHVVAANQVVYRCTVCRHPRRYGSTKMTFDEMAVAPPAARIAS